jgi:transcriptional regulator with XRE-family HTH domain
MTYRQNRSAQPAGEGMQAMPDKRAPSVRARQLAAELRRLRDESGLTGEEAGERLGWSAAKISRIETARSTVTPADVARLLDLYEVSGQRRERLAELGRSAGERGWWDAYGDTLGPEYATLIALEAQAERVRWYAPQTVPGLLQTEEYAREVIRSAAVIMPPGEIERRVQVRMTRQRILDSDEPLNLSVVLDEAALLRQIGGAKIMQGQLHHLVEAADKPNVELLVLSASVGAHPATSGEFTILAFPELSASDVVYLEHLTSDIYVEQEAQVFRYNLAYEGLRNLALDPGESRDLITGLIEGRP